MASSLEEEVQKMNIGSGKSGPSSKIRVQSPLDDDAMSPPSIQSKQSVKNRGLEIMPEKTGPIDVDA